MSHILKSESAASFVFTPTSPWFQLFPLCLLHPPPPPPPPLFSFSFFFCCCCFSCWRSDCCSTDGCSVWEPAQGQGCTLSGFVCSYVEEESVSPVTLWNDCSRLEIVCKAWVCVCVCVCVSVCVIVLCGRSWGRKQQQQQQQQHVECRGGGGGGGGFGGGGGEWYG